MAYDLEAGVGPDLPVGDRYFGPREWAGQGGGREGDFERGYLRGSFEGSRSRYTSEGYRGTNIDREVGMARAPERTPHWAVEEFERRYIGRSPTAEDREEPFWPRGTERLYGYAPEYLAPGPEFNPRYRGKGPKHYQRSRERILDDAAAALTREPELDAGDITVEVNDERDVILGGEVGHKADKRLAEDLVADVVGVHDVHNNIRVRR